MIIKERLWTKKGIEYRLREEWPDAAIPGILRLDADSKAPKRKDLVVGAIFSLPGTREGWNYHPDKANDVPTEQTTAGETHEVWQMASGVFLEFYKFLFKVDGATPETVEKAAAAHPEMIRRVFGCDGGAVGAIDESWPTQLALVKINDRYKDAHKKLQEEMAEKEDEDDEDEEEDEEEANGAAAQA